MELRLTIIALAFVGIVNAVPLQQWESNEQVTKCSRQCSATPENFNYEQGKTYTYAYETTTKLNLDGDDGPVIRVQAKADISVLEPCELALKLRDVVVDGPADKRDIKRALEQHSLVFGYDDGKVESVCASPDDQPWAINVKRGIVTGLQVSLRSLSGSQIVREKDVLGDCETNYEVIAEDGRSVQIRKSKNMASCGRRQSAIAAFFPRSYLSPASTAVQTLPIMSNDFECDITVTRKLVEKSVCKDVNAFLPMAWSQSAANVETQIKLDFLNVQNGQQVRRPSQQRRSHLLFARQPETERAVADDVLNILRDICAKVENEIESSVPAKFADLVYTVRQLSDEDAATVNKQIKRGQVCASKKIKDIWSDALVMDASGSSAKIIAEQIKNGEVSAARANYMMTMLAFANRPTRAAVKALAPLVADAASPRQAMLGVSALIRNLIAEEPSAVSSAEVKAVVDALIAIARREKNSDKAIVAIKSLRNIGHYGAEATRTLLEIATNKNLKNQVQVTAWAALKEAAGHEQVNQKALETFANTANDDEIRIAAYKVAIEKAERQSVQSIITVLKREPSKQVGSYVTSHMENLQESSNPHARQVRDLLTAENIPSAKFPKDIRKYSRNFEASQLFEAANVGAVVDADLIYSKSFAPRLMKVNITAPIAGKSINLFEAGIYQVGLEQQLEKFFGPSGSINVPEMFQEIADFFTGSNPEINEIARARRAARPAYRAAAAQDSEADAEAAFFLNVDGKTILYMSTNDADSNDMREIAQAIAAKAAKLSESIKEDRAFSFMFLDATHHVPSANGLPVKVDLNGTAILGYKVTENGVWPSVAVQLSTKVGFDVNNARPGVKLVQTFSSAPAITVKVEGPKVTFALPKNQIELIKYKSDMMIVDAVNGERALRAPSVQRANGCTTSFNKALGVELCSKFVTPKPFFNPKTPFLPFNGAWDFEVTLKKTDQGMQGWEYTLELPNDMTAESQTYRAAFNTPGSAIDREVAAELVLNAASGAQAARLRLKAPGKQIDSVASYKYDAQAAMYRGEVNVDQRDKYAVEVGMEKNQKDKKAEWKPKLRIEMPNAKPIQLGGSVILDQGRKQQLAFDLRSNQQSNKQFFRGQFIKEGQVGMTNEFKLSSDLQGDIGVLVFRIFGTADKQAKAVATDMKVEYQRPNQRKHTAKLVGKVQDLSISQLLKVNSFVELQMTQKPAANFHLSWNVQQKPQEHLENEITLMWRDQMRDPSRKIHILQVSRATGLNGGRTATTENVLNVNIAPLRINYELKAAGHMENGETPKFKVEFESLDKNDRRAAQPSKASFEYQHISRKPLKLSMDALLRTAAREIIYSDKLEEVAPNEYKGQSSFQWEPTKKAALDYTYRVKTDSRKTHHELDVEVKTPSMKYGTHHQGLLRMTEGDLEIRSKLNHERQQLWDFQSQMSGQGQSKVFLDTASFTSKFDTNPFERTKSASFELTGKSFPVSHQTNFQMTPDSFSAASKTIYQAKPVLTINAERSARKISQLSIQTPMFEAKLQGDQQSTPKSASIEIRTKSTPAHHRTVVSADSNKFEIKSKTQYKSKPVANIDALIARRGRSQVTIDIPQLSAVGEANLHAATRFAKIELTNKQLTHKSEITADRSGLIKASSTTKRSGQNLANFDGQYGQRSFARINTPHFASNAEYDQMTNEARFKVQDLTHNWQHASELAQRGAEWQLTSATEKSGRTMAQIDGSYSQARAALKINAQPADASFEYVPRQSAKWELKSKDSKYAHKTTVAAEPNAWVIVSKTDSQSRPYFHVDSRLSRREASKLRMETPIFLSNVEVDPSRAAKSLKIDLTGKGDLSQLKHNTVAAYEPENKFEFASMTERVGRDPHKILEVESKLYKRGQNSHVKIAAANWDAMFEKSPCESRTKSMKAIYNHRQQAIDHQSELIYEPSNMFDLKSTTGQRGQEMFGLDAHVSQQKRALAYRSQPADASLEVVGGRAATFKVDLKRKSIQHESTIAADRDAIVASSKTVQHGRPLVTVESKLTRNARSYLNVDARDRFDAKLEADLYNRVKTAKIATNCKTSRVSHSTDLTYEPRKQMTIKSRAQRSGAQLYNLDAALATADKRSHLNAAYDDNDLTVEVLPRQSAKWTLNAARAQLRHQADLAWDRDSYSVDSITSRRAQQLANLKARVSRSDKSTFELALPQGNAQFEASPYARTKTAKLAIAADRYNHQSQLSFEPHRQINFNMDNTHSGRQLLKVEASHANGQQSKLMIANADYNALAELDRDAARVTFNSPRIGHKTNTAWKSGRAGEFKIESNTDIDSRSAAKFAAQLQRNGKQVVKLEIPQGEGQFEVNYATPAKVAKITLKNAKSAHETEATLSADDLTVKSKTVHRQNTVANIDAALSRRRRSHLVVDTAAHKMRLDVSPYESVKTAKLAVAGLDSGYKHETSVSAGRGEATIKSLTEKDSAVIADVNGKFNTARYELALKSAPLDARAHFEPLNYNGNVEVRGKQLALEHSTNFALNSQATLKTSTNWNGKERFAVDIVAQRDQAKASMLNDMFQGKFAAQANKIAGEYQRRDRRNSPLLKASAQYAPEQNKVKAELQWDARDNEKKVEITAFAQPATRQNRKAQANVRVLVGSATEYVVESSMAQNLIDGPHDLEISYKAPHQSKKALKIHHEMGNGLIKCTGAYLEDGAEKVTVNNLASLKSSRNGLEVEASFDVKSQYKYQNIDGASVAFKHAHEVRRGSLESTSSVNGRLGNGKPVKAELAAKFDRNAGKASLTASAETPIYDFANQNAELTASWSNKHLVAAINGKTRAQQLDATAAAQWDSDKVSAEAQAKYDNKQTAAKVEAAYKNGRYQAEASMTSDYRQLPNARFAANADKQQAQLTAELDNRQRLSVKAQRDSNSASFVADVDGEKYAVKANADNKNAALTVEGMGRNLAVKGQYEPMNSASFTADLDNDRKVQAKIAKVGNDGITAEVKTAWTPAYAVVARSKRSAQSYQYELTAKKDNSQVAAANVAAKYSRQGAELDARAMLQGRELINIQGEAKKNGEEQTATVSVRGAQIPQVRATAKFAQNSAEIKPHLEVCIKGNQCYTANGSYRNQDYRRTFDRQLTAQVSAPGRNNEARLDWTLTNKNNFVNKLAITAQDINVGYDLEHTVSGSSQGIKAELHLPKRTIALNAAANQVARDEFKMTAELQADARREPQDKLTVEINYKQSVRYVRSEIKASHPSLSRPMTVSLEAESKYKTQAKLVLDVNRDATKRTEITAIVNGQAVNKTIELTAKSQDGKLNAQLLAHISLANEKLTNGISWKWNDRRNRRQEGMYVIEADSQKVNLATNSPAGFVQAEGTYAIRGQKMTANLNANLNGDRRKIDLELDANQAPCAQVSFKDQSSAELAKWRGCIAAQSGQALKMTSTLSAQGQPDSESSITFDQSNGRVFRAHLKWDPEAVGNALIKIQEITGTGRQGRRSNNFGLNEIANELQHKRQHLFGDLRRDAYEPLSKSLGEEWSEFADEMQPLTDRMPDMSAARQAFADAANAVTPDFSTLPVQADKAIRQLTKAIKANFDRNSSIYRVAYAYDRRGAKAAAQELVKALEQAAAQASQVTGDIAGNYSKFITNAIPQQWVRAVRDAAARGSEAVVNNDVVKSVGKMAADSASATRDQLAAAVEYFAQRLAKAIDESMTNKDLKQIVKVLEEILKEVQRELKNVDTRDIDEMTQEMIKYLMSAEAWSSHARTTTWNPEEGEITIELRTPVDIRRFAANAADNKQYRRSTADKVYRSRFHA